MKFSKAMLHLTTSCACLLAWSASALAQTAAPPAARAEAKDPRVSEIIVTARKRQESLLEVPVIETAVPQERLERLQATNLTDLPKLVPGLNLGQGLLSIGTLVSIRGVGTASLDPGIDQSVSLNIDGLALGQGLAFQSGMFDLQQVEVLKGPQALFYGKSSPGGVIALRTADPTSEIEVIARGAYEFEADTSRAELIASGPVTDTLKLRVSGMYSESSGYFHNRAVAAPGTGARNPAYDDAPRARNYMIRTTALWNPTDTFDARLKVNYVNDRTNNAEGLQLSNCPGGTASPVGIPFLGGEDCRIDRTMRIVDLDPAAFPGLINKGRPFLESEQTYGTLELNYQIRPELTLTSTTGMYQLGSKSMVNTSQTSSAGPTLGFQNRFKRRDFTQELRLNSDFASPVNFTLGGFYQDGRISDHVTGIPNRSYFTPVFIALLSQNGETAVDIETYSAFGQLRWEVLPGLELAGGLRWTDEERSESVLNYLSGTPTPVAVPNPRIKSSNTAPEFTATWRPTDDVTLFAAYKRGYKSGSFSIATVPVATIDNSFGDERVEGGEIGLKSRLFDRQLLFNIAAYNYRYRGLQVGAVEPLSSTGQIVIRTVNAGSARTRGVDMDAAYRPEAVPELSLNAAINWNEANYGTLNNIPCWSGQTPATGCTGGVQNLSGFPMIRAPRWQATFGFDYERELSDGMTLVFSNSNQFSSRYLTTLAAGRPNDDQFQQSFIKTDLSLALRGPEDAWEVAIIGKNLTDRLTSGNCSIANFAGGLVFPTGHAGEMACYMDRGREVWARLTYRPLARR
ncbi:TonB-dependent receptor [Phenylobacterium sp. LjRoot219]|uniref:TonB-dependent receptor n=1 Tax=Phenylobacterium sp. LjRoot219 TaxID=3342283 RepID=UPI003ECE5263